MRHDRYLERLDITPRAEVSHMPAHKELAQYSPTEAHVALNSLLSILTFDNDQ